MIRYLELYKTKLLRAKFAFGLVVLFGIFIFMSCEENITLDFPEYESKIVVEGSIEQGDVARVFLTRSSGYFDEISFDSIDVEFMGTTITVPEVLYNTLVLNAFITVSDGVLVDTLHMSFHPYLFPYIYYVGSEIIGEPGRNYHLYIEVEDSIKDEIITIEGITSIPEPVAIDSLWFEFSSEDEDSLGYIFGVFDDPAEEVNFYRIFSKTIGRDSTWVHPFNSVWHDRNINGQEDTRFITYHGDNSLEDPEDYNRWYFRLGEHVTIKFCSIDRDHFNFWNSYQQNSGGEGNPFTEPVQLNSNVTGGLGVWGGYGVTYMDFEVVYIDPVEE